MAGNVQTLTLVFLGHPQADHHVDQVVDPLVVGEAVVVDGLDVVEGGPVRRR